MVIFSGIQPTGRKHLGNYIGAIIQYVDGPGPRRSGDLLHRRPARARPSPTTRPSCASARYDTAALLLAAGLDPERCILFRQGDVPEHTELTLAAVERHLARRAQPHAPVPRQVRRRSASWSSAGLLFYPVLMAADVLAYRAHEVPVGEDQREHIELMRDVAERFNARFGETLVVPEGRIPEVGARVRDLQEPERKMSTTGGTPSRAPSTSLDEPDAIVQEVQARGRPTPAREIVARRRQARHLEPDRDPRGRARHRRPRTIEREFAGSRLRRLQGAPSARRSSSGWRPVRERYEELRADEARARGASSSAGADKARAIAAPIVADVREAMGVGPSAVRRAAAA